MLDQNRIQDLMPGESIQVAGDHFIESETLFEYVKLDEMSCERITWQRDPDDDSYKEIDRETLTIDSVESHTDFV